MEENFLEADEDDNDDESAGVDKEALEKLQSELREKNEALEKLKGEAAKRKEAEE